MEQLDYVDRLVAQLARPIFVLRMAKGLESAPGPRGEGAWKRAEQARNDIDRVVRAYIQETSVWGL